MRMTYVHRDKLGSELVRGHLPRCFHLCITGASVNNYLDGCSKIYKCVQSFFPRVICVKCNQTRYLNTIIMQIFVGHTRRHNLLTGENMHWLYTDISQGKS